MVHGVHVWEQILTPGEHRPVKGEDINQLVIVDSIKGSGKKIVHCYVFRQAFECLQTQKLVNNKKSNFG